MDEAVAIVKCKTMEVGIIEQLELEMTGREGAGYSVMWHGVEELLSYGSMNASQSPAGQPMKTPGRPSNARTVLHLNWRDGLPREVHTINVLSDPSGERMPSQCVSGVGPS